MKQGFDYLLIFTKIGVLKYISHLDLLRLFQRAIRRAGLNVVFSKGYHPIPKIKFERALKLGIESSEEKLYLKLSKPILEKELMKNLNAQLPSEIKVLQTLRI